MRKEDFFEALGEIDDDMVKEAKIHGKKQFHWKIWGTMAACLVLLCALAIHLLPLNHDDEVISQGVADAAPMVYVNDTLYKQSSDQQSYPEMRDDFIYLGQILNDITADQSSGTDGVPNENFQANHPVVGCGVYQYGENIVIHINHAYWLYIEV